MIENLDKRIQDIWENTNNLYPFLREIGETSGLVINPTGNDTSLDIGGVSYAVPTLSAEDVVKAYNTVVAGGATSVSNKAGTSHFAVTQADSLHGIAINIDFFGIATIEYMLEGSTVEVVGIPHGLTKDLLWENASPTSTFSPQTITINNYKTIIVVFKNNKSDTVHSSCLVNNDNSLYSCIMLYASTPTTPTIPFRFVTYNNSDLTFGVGYYIDLSTHEQSQSNNVGIPLKVYGIK